MPDPTLEIMDRLLALPRDERERIAVRLFDSLDEDDEEAVEKAWIEEARRRITEIESGAVVCRPMEEVMAELRARFL